MSRANINRLGIGTFTNSTDLLGIQNNREVKIAKTTFLTNLASSLAAVFAPYASRVLPGTIVTYAGTSAPTGYLECDGSEVLKATYPALFAVCGTTFGAGTETEFALPDFSEETVFANCIYLIKT